MDPETVRRLIDELEGEVNNGGFDQYFFNSAGDEAAQAIAALEAVRATRTAAIVRGACGRFPGGLPATDRAARQVALEQISPEGDAFEDDDDAFLAYEDDLAALVAAFESSRR